MSPPTFRAFALHVAGVPLRRMKRKLLALLNPSWLPSLAVLRYYLRYRPTGTPTTVQQAPLLVFFPGMSNSFRGAATSAVIARLSKDFPSATITSRAHYYSAWNSIGGFHSWDVETTTTWLASQKAWYPGVYLIGSSAGGFMAMLCGSLAGVSGVLTYDAQTHRSHLPTNLDPRFVDVAAYVVASTPITLVSNLQGTEEHALEQAQRVSYLPGVRVIAVKGLDFGNRLDSGVISRELRIVVTADGALG